MPVFNITSPDGKKYQITAPEGATREDALAKLQSQIAPNKPAPNNSDNNTLPGGQNLMIGSYDTGIPMSQHMTEFMAGMGRRMNEIGSLGTNEGDPSANKRLDKSPYATAGSIATDIGGTALLGGGLKAAEGLPLLGKSLGYIGKGMIAPQKVIQAATGGALYGGLTSPDRAQGIVGGSVGGALGSGIPKLAGRIAKPYLADGAQSLINKGIPLTTGERLGGMAKTAEEKMISMPVLGDFIRNAKHRSLSSYSGSVVNDALQPIQKAVPDNIKSARGSIDYANNLISDQYNKILSKINVRVDKPFMTEINTLKTLAQNLPDREAKKFNDIISRNIEGRIKAHNGFFLGNTYKNIDRSLREEYQRFIKSSDPYVQDMGRAIKTAHSALRDMAKRQNPELANQLSNTDTAFAKMRTIDDAGSMLGAKNGEFSPSQMLNAIKKNTDKRKFAAGKGFNQAETEQAKNLLANEIPNSGTADRIALNLGTLGGLGVVSHPALAGLGLGSALYTEPGQEVLNSIMLNRPAMMLPVRKGLEAISPYTGLLGIAAGANSVQ